MSNKDCNGLKDALPHMARHEGVWDGTHRHFDAAGTLIDEHRGRVLCRFPDDPPVRYWQTSELSWTDGRTARQELVAHLRDGRLWWDTPLVAGWASEMPMDETGRSLVLYWQYRADPSLYVYEMVQLSDCGRKRSRTWQWFRDGELERRTTIEERLSSRDWRTLDARLNRAA